MLALAVLCLSIPFAAFAEGAKVEEIGAFADQDASEALRKALEPKGYRVTLDGGAYCDIWLRGKVPTQAKTDVSGAIYTEIPETAVVGVISFAKDTTDFRGQAVKAGAYTLRYALHPADGNHMGISAYRDFLLLVPVAADQNPDTTFKFDELMKMSARASGTNHPAPIDLVSPEGRAPGVSKGDHEHTVFAGKLKTQAGKELPIAFVIKGVAEQ